MASKQRRRKMSTEELVEIRLLRLAAAAVDVCDQMTLEEIENTPSLVAVLEACDVLFDELGWGPLEPSGYSDGAGGFLNGRGRT
ncbi:MAG TPA: hypothetical protein VK442_03475 [Xanthobacteraceae bacterium]|nr:hypothetical protein [Xanthobacteraceae bacterium]